MLFDGIRDLKLKNTVANWSINANSTPNLLPSYLSSGYSIQPTLVAQFYETNTTGYLSSDIKSKINLENYLQPL